MDLIKFVLLMTSSVILAGCGGPKQEFIEQCTIGGANKSTCSCIYDALETKYGENYMEEAVQNNNVQKAFAILNDEENVNLIRSCAIKNQ
ncbi:hypothetical protein HMPREF3022_09205 [Neisseria sp. HMSC065C04]|uniref:hypothetical protein n=1 Tax=unclassified Neisseria TaxID=2623750 RepID=UPI00066CD1D0|nr:MULTISPECIES: hypothetical protein [unclassified Neisseria]MBF1276820.1 hypothetical protein [Neisseria sp.]OFO66392.1 hypothetical protein HMPREF3022_09205 [Neisseria sp. HMSC065C04]